MLRMLALSISGLSTIAFALVIGPTSRLCDDKEFPSASSVYISFKDSSGKEVYNSMCSGSIVEDPRFFLTDEHCLYREKDLLGYFSNLPKPIVEHYGEKQRQYRAEFGKDPKGLLKAEYFVDGIPVESAVTANGRQAVLILKKPSTRPVAQLALNHPFEKGTVCHTVGFSPKQELAALPGKKREELRSMEDFVEYAQRRAEVFGKPTKRCGQTTYSGKAIDSGSDVQLFEGMNHGKVSTEPGDSGGPCYVKDKEGQWRVAGINELGALKTFVNSKGELEENHDHPSNNGIVLFNGKSATDIEGLMSEARQIRDRGLPVVDGETYFGDGVHFRVRRSNPTH